uniref:Uncharacterized protein n=1 Tax=Schistocephalus solidus TaxID=70667 RepID=A0A0X3P3X3_SCHSO
MPFLDFLSHRVYGSPLTSRRFLLIPDFLLKKHPHFLLLLLLLRRPHKPSVSVSSTANPYGSFHPLPIPQKSEFPKLRHSSHRRRLQYSSYYKQRWFLFAFPTILSYLYPTVCFFLLPTRGFPKTLWGTSWPACCSEAVEFVEMHL